VKQIVIVGAGGFGREAAWVVERINAAAPQFKLLGFCDDAADKRTGQYGGYPLLGPLSGVKARRDAVGFFCAIGNNRVRRDVFAEGRALGLEPVSLIDPSAVIAPDVEIGRGSFVGVNSVVSVGASLGEGVLVNHQVCVGHDARRV